MKKTAVEWFASQIKGGQLITNQKFKELLEKAKEMDKEQHNETWDIAHQAGRFEGKGIAENNWQTFESHWEETFK